MRVKMKNSTLLLTLYGADDIAALAPPPDVQTAGIEIIQPHINRRRRRARLNALFDIFHDVAKPQARPVLAIEQRQLGPVGIGLELGEGWQGGGHFPAPM